MNYQTPHFLHILLICFFVPTVHAMEMTIEKPIIEGIIKIGQLCYASQAYHDELNKVGHFCSTIYTPLIGVKTAVAIENRIYDWTIRELPNIKQFEESIHQNNANHNQNQKLFPSCIPITCFNNTETGTILSFIIHGYTTNLTCFSNLLMVPPRPLSKQDDPFCKKFDLSVATFLLRPIIKESSNMTNLLENNIIKPSPLGLIHGKDGYKHLIIALIKGHDEKILLLLQLLGSIEKK